MQSSFGRRIQRAGYVLSDVLDESGPTILLRALRSSDEAEVVLKLPREPSPQTLEVYRREFALLKTIDCEAVAGVIDLEIHERSPLLVLESRSDERPLLKHCQRSDPMPLERFFPIAIGLAEAVGSLHGLGLVHHSIRASNVLVAPSRPPRLVGFDQATRLPEERRIARVREDLTADVLAAMSPEQTGRVNCPVDYRTDLYSLGVVLYQLLSGAPPFEAEDVSGWVFAHVAVIPRPLSERRPDLPPFLAEVIHRLLEKSPESRYQNAFGLRHDLRAVRSQTKPLRLGELDPSGRFRLSERLYGRAGEIAELGAAFESVAAGSRRLVLVSGYSGIGKTALVHELSRPLTESRARLVSGKFDQYQRAVPYSAVRAALGALASELAGEDPDRRQAWRSRIGEQLGETLPVIADIVPELELLVGRQPAPTQLGASDAQARFQLAFRRLIGALIEVDRPLILFLDDLQWIDLASLKLVEALLEAEELSHLLVIGAYRDNEVDSGHPLLEAAARLSKAEDVTRLELAPLLFEDLVSLVCEAFSCAAERALPLARLLHAKTAGNPFFTRQFLRLLYLERLLSFEFESGRWTWDLERASLLSATDNVVDLMVRRLKRLAPLCQEALRIAACLGNSFDLRTLAMIRGGSTGAALRALWPALETGLVKLADAARELGEAGPGGKEPMGDAAARYRFLHDRVQQGAYSLLPAEERERLHLRIGRALRAMLSEDQLELRIFDVAGHFEHAHRHLVDPEERLAVAGLCARSAERAVASIAYASAIRYAEVGLELLGSDGWEQRYDLALPLQRLLGECQGLAGDFERAEQTLRAASDRCRSPLDRAGVLTVLMEAFVSKGQVGRALQTLIDILAEFDLRLDADTVEAVAAEASSALAAARGARRVEDIVASEEARDPEAIALLRALGRSIDTAYMSGHDWVVAVTSIGVRAALEKGVTASASMIFSTYGLVAAEPATADGYRLRHEYGRIGALLAERFGDLAWISRSHVSNPHMYAAPFRQAVKLQQRGVEAGWACGAFTWGGYAELERACMRLAAGDPLPMLAEELRARRVRVDESRRLVSAACLSLLEGLIASLRGQSRDRFSLGRSEEDAAELEAAAKAMGPYVEAKWFTFKLFLAAIFGDYEGARDLRSSAAGALHGLIGLPCEHLYQLASALALAGLHRRVSGDEAAELLEELRGLEASYREHALANADYEPAFFLVRALSSEASGDAPRAAEEYNQAVAAARERRQVPIEAIANERAGALSLRVGRERLAAFYQGEAGAAYRAWGAIAKARELGDEPDTAGPPMSEAHSSLRLGDAESLLKTSLAILGELRLEEQLQRQLELLLENVGAQRGLLILERDGELVFAAESRLTSSGIHTTLGEAELSPPQRRLVDHVRRSSEALTLNDAWVDRRFGFADEPELERPRSILCTPIVRKPQLAAVLYLDTRAAAQWFTPIHRDTLQFLSALATVSLQNALFYRDLQLEVEERKRAEGKLRAERDFWAEVIARIPTVVRGLKPDGTTTFVNPAGERVTGYLERELIGENWWRTFYPGERYQQVEELLPRMAAGEQHTGHERSLIDRRGQERLISWTSANLFDEEGRLSEVVGFGTDITAERQMEAEAAALEKQLRIAQKLETIGTMAGGIAHDFNNILTPILGLSELIATSAKADPVISRQVDGVLQSALRAKSLVAQILTFSRQGPEVERRSTRLQDLIEEVLVLLRASLPATIDIRREVDSGCPPVLANPGQLHQVLLNLCTNAGHAMRSGGVLTLRLGREEDRVRLAVQDTGAGMEMAIQERIFMPFFTTKGPGEGTGLGLSVVHGIVEGHGGSIAVDSRVGEGSTFTLEFPVLDAATELPEVETEDRQAGRGRVLVVDDEPLIMELMGEFLRQLGYESSCFLRSSEALEAFRQAPHSFLVLLTDYTMPEMTGLALITEARRIRPDLPAILMTGQSPGSQTPEALLAGDFTVLHKPFRKAVLFATLQEVCAPR